MGGECKQSGTHIHMVAPIRLDVLRTEGALTALESETVNEMSAQVDDLITVEKRAPSKNKVVTGLTLTLMLMIASAWAASGCKSNGASCTGNKYLCESAQRSEQRTMFVHAVGMRNCLIYNYISTEAAPTGIGLQFGDNEMTPTATQRRCDEHTECDHAD